MACTYGVRALSWDSEVDRIVGGERDKALDLEADVNIGFPKD